MTAIWVTLGVIVLVWALWEIATAPHVGEEKPFAQVDDLAEKRRHNATENQRRNGGAA